MNQAGETKVLIVDDDPLTRKMLTEQVKKLGYRPICATNGIEGLKILIEQPELKAVILDLLMPHFNGYDFLKAVDAMYSTALLQGPSKIIVHTSVAEYKELRELATLRAVHTVLPKPTSLEQLRHDLELCCAKVVVAPVLTDGAEAH